MTLVSGQNRPVGIAVDSSDVYWVDAVQVLGQVGGGRVMKVPKAGGVATVIASNQTNPTGVAVTASQVIWANRPLVGGAGEAVVDAGGILSAPIGGLPDGGRANTLASGLTSGALVLAGTRVFYTATRVTPAGGEGALMAVPADGGSPTIVSILSVSEAPVVPPSLAFGGSYVYWANTWANPIAILQAPLDGGPATPFETASAYSLAADNESLYAVVGDGYLVKKSLSGGATVTLATCLVPGAQGSFWSTLAVDNESVYWGCPDSVEADGSIVSGRLLKVPLNGGETNTLVVGTQPFGIAVDSTSVYWTDYGPAPHIQNGSIRKLTPK